MSRLLELFYYNLLLVSGIISVSSGLSSVCPSFSVLFLVGLKYVMILGCQVTLTSEGLVWVTPVPAMGVGASGLCGSGWTCYGTGLPGGCMSRGQEKALGSPELPFLWRWGWCVKGCSVFHSRMELSFLPYSLSLCLSQRSGLCPSWAQYSQ